MDHLTFEGTSEEFLDLGLPDTGGLPPIQGGDVNFQNEFLRSLEGTAAGPVLPEGSPPIDIEAITFTQCERDGFVLEAFERGLVDPGQNQEFAQALVEARSRQEECSMPDQFGPEFGNPVSSGGDLIIPTFQQTDQPTFGGITTTSAPPIGFDPGFPDIEEGPGSGSGPGTSAQDDPFFDDTTFLGNIGAILLEGASAILNAVINAPANIIVLAANALGRELTATEAQALQSAFSQDPQRIAASIAALAAERAGFLGGETTTTTTPTGGMTMPTDPFSSLIQGIAGCDERFFRPAPERVRAVPLLCVPRPDGGSEFYINIKLNRSKLIRMEASRGRRRGKR